MTTNTYTLVTGIAKHERPFSIHYFEEGWTVIDKFGSPFAITDHGDQGCALAHDIADGLNANGETEELRTENSNLHEELAASSARCYALQESNDKLAVAMRKAKDDVDYYLRLKHSAGYEVEGRLASARTELVQALNGCNTLTDWLNAASIKTITNGKE